MIRSMLIRLALVLALVCPFMTPQSALASTIVVNTHIDILDAAASCGLVNFVDLPGPDGSTSLREAICAANNDPGADVINFAIPLIACKINTVCNLKVNTGLPALTDDYTTINGYTQTNAVEATKSAPAAIKIVLDGFNTSFASGLLISSAHNLIKGLVILRFDYYGIRINGSNADQNTIQGNYIGVDVAGLFDNGNGYYGISIENGASGNLIGGSEWPHRNIISGNDQHGIFIFNDGSDNNTVSGNIIGANVSGTLALPNSWSGVYIGDGAENNIIGGVTSIERNLISGNTEQGIAIISSTTNGNMIKGNFIGTNSDGARALANGQNGILIQNAQHTTIGGSTSGERNIISGNGWHGVHISFENAAFNTVSGNYIGISYLGTAAVSNSSNGVYINSGAHENTIGGDISGERNVIAGNGFHGIQISSSGTMTNTVSGNYIGLKSNGIAILANGMNGISIDNSAHHNIIGGIAVGQRNVISGNNYSGIHLLGSNVIRNHIMGNYIGTDASGAVDLGNSQSGVVIENGPYYNEIGGNDPEEGNLISGNNTGIILTGSTTMSNTVRGNIIGLNAAAAASLGNSFEGIYITNGAHHNVVGGTSDAEGNIISGNVMYGVSLNGLGTDFNIIAYNIIGSNDSGDPGLGNLQNGIVVTGDGRDNTIGPNNLVVNNGSDGVKIIGAGTYRNIITENSIFQNLMGINLVSGSNGNILPPQIMTLIFGGTNLVIQGSACTGCTVEIFSSIDGDGEGQKFLGNATATGGIFSISVPYTEILGAYLTATATLSTLGTSEFSAVFDWLPEKVYLPLTIR